jgi:hypothetical protein
LRLSYDFYLLFHLYDALYILFACIEPSFHHPWTKPTCHRIWCF